MRRERLHQFHVYNEHVDVLITTNIKKEAYAEAIASLWLVDYHDYKPEDVDNLQVEYIHSFGSTTITDLKKLEGNALANGRS